MSQSVTEIYTLCDHYDDGKKLCLRRRLQTKWYCRNIREAMKPYELPCIDCKVEGTQKAEADMKDKRLCTRVVTKMKKMVEDVMVKRGVREIKWQKNSEKWTGPPPYAGMYEGSRRTVSKFEE